MRLSEPQRGMKTAKIEPVLMMMADVQLKSSAAAVT